MEENTNVQPGVEGTNQAQDSGNLVQDSTNQSTLTLEDAQEALKKAREEAAKYRTQLKETKTILTQKEKQELVNLEEQGKYKELYEATLSKLNTYEPLVEDLKTKAQMFEEYQTKRRENLLKQLPSDYKDNLDKVDTDTLEFLVQKLTPKPIVNSPGNALPGEDKSKPNPNPYQGVMSKYAEALNMMQKL